MLIQVQVLELPADPVAGARRTRVHNVQHRRWADPEGIAVIELPGCDRRRFAGCGRAIQADLGKAHRDGTR